MSQSNRQGGSVATFLVVGLILALLALGAIYGVRQYMASQRLAPVADESLINGSGDKNSPEEGVVKEPSQDENTANNNTGGETPGSTSQPVDSGQPTSESLPQSGPTSNLAGIIGVSLMIGMTVAYIGSRRKAL